MSTMAMLHESSVRSDIESRIRALRADSRGRWGKMSVDQMLWHVNQAMSVALGDVEGHPQRIPLPGALVKFMVLKLPWVKGAPTNPAFVTENSHDFDAERDRCLDLIHRIVAKPLDSTWSSHPAFGLLTGKETSQLMAKHLDHHLRQFSV
jgi:hypothetical protein